MKTIDVTNEYRIDGIAGVSHALRFHTCNIELFDQESVMAIIDEHGAAIVVQCHQGQIGIIPGAASQGRFTPIEDTRGPRILEATHRDQPEHMTEALAEPVATAVAKMRELLDRREGRHS